MFAATRRNWTAMLALVSLSAGIGTVLVSSRSAAQPAPGETNAPGDVNKLQEERIATLRDAAKLATELYARGMSTPEEVNRCNQQLVEAELDAATSGKQRVEILQNAFTDARRAEELATQQYQAGLITQLGRLEAKAYRLRMEIDLAKEMAKQ
jgi:outer membrane protein TolC